MRKILPMVLLLALAGAAAQAADDAQPKVVDRKSPDYIRCERRAPIGSMIKSLKLCRTNAEWAKINDASSKEARDVVEQNTNRPPGGP